MSYRRQGSASSAPVRRSSQYERHHKYYIETADLHLVAENIVFRVHGYFFSRESPIFHRRMNPTSPGDTKEGSSEEDPVFLDDTPEEFEKLLWVFYNPRYSIYEGTLDQWSVILRLADKYNFEEVKDLAVREMHKKPELTVVEKMGLYQKYRVPEKYLVPLYAELCERENPLAEEEGEVLGAKAAVLVGGMRERLRVEILEKKVALLRAELSAREQDGDADLDQAAEPHVQLRLSNVLEGMSREEVIAALEERIGIQAGTSIILEEGNHGSKEPSSPTPGSPSRRQSNGDTPRGTPRKRREPDIDKGYVIID
ncbi:hypothetical protein CPB83DRAFT_897424 [Crepidotus variabilis]|uniref:BTB domain-containing protein n=1 Tax=Crepidotus variabilis TaxID=179855 RepID=A0A9P6JLU3_9AGAR|nr:hypothetical protein CPB83DRAFT_897424 [Crepidotus variabilis]